MPQTFIVDQAQTFKALAFLSAEPKIEYGSRDKQEMTKDGLPKWEIQLVAGFYQFGKIANEVLKVNYAGPHNPADYIGMYQPVQLLNFTVGVNPPEERTNDKGVKRIVGGTAWYRCDDIQPVNVGPAPKS